MAVLVLSRRRAMLVQKPDGATAKKTAGPAAKKTAGPAARVAARQTVRTVRQARRTGRKTMQRMVLTILINALENDVMRRAIIMWLKLKLARSRLPV
jgi:hypothetical protein